MLCVALSDTTICTGPINITHKKQFFSNVWETLLKALLSLPVLKFNKYNMIQTIQCFKLKYAFKLNSV